MPRTETRIRTLYQYNELSDDAKAKALDNYRDQHAESIGNDWADEWRDSLNGWCESVGIKPRDVDWEVSPCSHTYASLANGNDRDGSCAGERFDNPEHEPTGARLWRWIVNQSGWLAYCNGDCPFTGYCGDEPLMDPIREFIARPTQGTTLADILGECVHRWAIEWRNDMEGQNEDEAIIDAIEANEYEFTAAGRLA